MYVRLFVGVAMMFVVLIVWLLVWGQEDGGQLETGGTPSWKGLHQSLFQRTRRNNACHANGGFSCLLCNPSTNEN